MLCFTPHDLLFILLQLLVILIANNACNQAYLNSLMSLKVSTSSPPLNWSSNDCCHWEGISCDHKGQVTHVWLPSKGLTGSVSPNFLGNLMHLSHLNLSHNSLSGSLPSGFFSSLNQLMILDLSYNYLVGDVSLLFSSNGSSTHHGWPPSIQIIDMSSNHFHGTIQSSFLERAWNLIELNVSNNSFQGPIPSHLCMNSRFVRLLDFSFNNHTGQIPLGLGACSKLEIFRASSNSLFGLLPNDLYSVTALEEISLPSNNLSGPISDDIVNLTKLTLLELYANRLSDKLPPNIGRLSKLKHMLLHTNSFPGSLPSSLMNCTNIIELNLRFNLFEGNISNFNFSCLQQLTILDFGYNGFTGSFPISFQSYKSLSAIRLSGNQLEGQIPSEIAQLKYLSYFSLSFKNLTNITAAIKILMRSNSLEVVLIGSNFLHERLPNDDDIVGFQNLRLLDIGLCQLTGQLPMWLSMLNKLEILGQTGNRITGSIPGWLSTLPRLKALKLGHNLISGEFPKELCALPSLVSAQAYQRDNDYLLLPIYFIENNKVIGQSNSLSYWYRQLSFENNSLSGNIPIEIGRLKLLRALQLGHNNFTGNIPDQISEITDLEDLDLSTNQLSGEIPASLACLHFLATFSVANNNLHGQIPSGTQLQRFDTSAYEGNLRLCGAPLPRCDHITNGSKDKDIQNEKDGRTIPWFHITVMFSFITGFGAVCGPLAFNRNWRDSYFRYLNNLKDQLYVAFTVSLARLHRRIRFFLYVAFSSFSSISSSLFFVSYYILICYFVPAKSLKLPRTN